MAARPPPGQPDLKFDNMTRQDLKKIEKSMKRPEFMGLLNEYMIEISDPKNKAEYDEYLRQMQREHELPKHMKIVELTPKFCFRTFIVSQKNKKHEMKFFVNMCQSEYLEKPSCEPTQGEDGKVGYSWKVPNSMGKIRYDQDKHNNPCQVVDIAFHPDTYRFAAKKEFQEMMINIALEAAERQLGERKETLSRDYVVLKNVICKGQDGKPALLPIRFIDGKQYNKGEGPTAEPERDNEGKETKLQREINKQKEEHDRAKLAGKEPPKEEEKEEELQEENKLIVDLEKGVQRPKYSTIFTYPVDYSEFIENPAAGRQRKVPTVFNIEFSIPRVESMEQIAGQTLEINDRKILLKIGEKYFIDLEFEQFKLKYVLLTANAKAKYDKKKKVLRIVIPVDQTVKYFQDEEKEVGKEGGEGEKGAVVESEVWKNKVLDFTDQNVSVKMLSNEPVEETPKLIEEIDEEDQITEQPVPKPPADEDQKEEEHLPKAQKFTLSTYYPKKPATKGENRRIGHLFQQTADKIVLVLQMKNYKKQEIRTFVDEQHKEYMVEWNQNAKEGNDVQLIRFEHLRLGEEFAMKVEKTEVVQRVGFVAVMIQKKSEEKGKFWTKEAVQAVSYEGDSELHVYQQFNAYWTKLHTDQQKKKIEQALKEEEIVEKPSQPQSIAHPSPITVQSTSKQQSPSDQPSVPQPIHALNSQSATSSIFSNLQPQFLQFQVPFLSNLD